MFTAFPEKAKKLKKFFPLLLKFVLTHIPKFQEQAPHWGMEYVAPKMSVYKNIIKNLPLVVNSTPYLIFLWCLILHHIASFPFRPGGESYGEKFPESTCSLIQWKFLLVAVPVSLFSANESTERYNLFGKQINWKNMQEYVEDVCRAISHSPSSAHTWGSLDPVQFGRIVFLAQRRYPFFFI